MVLTSSRGFSTSKRWDTAIAWTVLANVISQWAYWKLKQPQKSLSPDPSDLQWHSIGERQLDSEGSDEPCHHHVGDRGHNPFHDRRDEKLPNSHQTKIQGEEWHVTKTIVKYGWQHIYVLTKRQELTKKCWDKIYRVELKWMTLGREYDNVTDGVLGLRPSNCLSHSKFTLPRLCKILLYKVARGIFLSSSLVKFVTKTADGPSSAWLILLSASASIQLMTNYLFFFSFFMLLVKIWTGAPPRSPHPTSQS